MWKVFKKKSAPDLKIKEEKKEAAPAVKTPEVSKETAKVRTSSYAHVIFLKPLVSEKNSIAASRDIYAFAVAKKSNKVAVAKAFRAIYNVKPLSVRVMIMPAKQKRYGRISGVRREWKKAIIRVPRGSKVDIYAGV